MKTKFKDLRVVQVSMEGGERVRRGSEGRVPVVEKLSHLYSDFFQEYLFDHTLPLKG